MPFTKKFPNAGETIHIRVPKSYKESVIELCIALDSKFQQDVTKGNTTIKKFIREEEDGLAVLMGDSTIQLSRDHTHRSGGV